MHTAPIIRNGRFSDQSDPAAVMARMPPTATTVVTILTSLAYVLYGRGIPPLTLLLSPAPGRAGREQHALVHEEVLGRHSRQG